MSVSSVLFDLDGTLVDPAGAITNGIRHAVVAHGLPDPGEQRVAALVGPPLQVGLRTLDGVDESNIDSIIAAYRLRYAQAGMDESRVYPGLTTVLGALRAANIHLAVTTAKPEPIARELIGRKGLDVYLDAIHGNQSEHGDHGASKAHIVAAALESGKLDPARSVVVGDRHYDLDAARAHGIASIGVHWGFGQPGELDAADHTVRDARELATLLLGDGAATLDFADTLQEGTR